ncbi:unnamed protein product [Gongylonema pulchrum]|uniref:Zinc finger protein n=1 Tax=Gongylonema pulchrum TaxID=637853 RepID=A0A183D910_9BILA|nr:unnamed protein product [Gongylonema pulchrum]
MPASAATVMMTDVSVEMPQPGTSSSDGAASVTRYHQMTEPINNNNITNNNSNGEASQVAESSGDMSSRSAQHDEIDDDEMVRVKFHETSVSYLSCKLNSKQQMHPKIEKDETKKKLT